jgi:type II secretory pathway pseudopilin PulG
VEILIVVMIVSIVALMVVPRFTRAAEDSREVALKMDIRTLREAVYRYTQEHNGLEPHQNSSGAVDVENFRARLLERTDEDGTLNPAGVCGPYLKNWPANPYAPDGVARDVKTGKSLLPPRDNSSGWYLDTVTGLISPNSTMGGEFADEEAQLEAEKLTGLQRADSVSAQDSVPANDNAR